MKAQFFIISSVIMIYVIVLTFQYLTGFSDIRLSGVEEHQELSYIKNIKDSFIQILNTSNISNNGDMNKIVKDIDFTKNFFKQELLKKGIDFDSKFIFFSNGFESNDLSDWSGVYGTPQILSGTVYNGINSLYSNGIQYVTKNLSGVSEVYVRAYVNFNTLPSNPNKYYFMDLYENSNQILGLGLENENGAYKLIVYSNSFSGPWISPAINIYNSEWHYFELYWLENGTNSILKIWYDGQLEIVSQAIDSGGKGKLINQYNFGGANAVGGTPDLYVDCIAIGSDYVGDKCFPDEQNYFDFTLKTNGMHTETEFPYQEKIVPNPIWFNNFVNNTVAGQPTLFSLNWTDVVDLSGYIFSFDNCTGSFTNDAWVPMTGLNNWSSVIKAISPIVGCTIRWQVYANDTSGKWNTSYIFSLTTTGTPLLIQFVSPTDNNGATVSRNWSYVNVSITDALNTSSFIDWNRNLVGYWSMDSYNSSGVYDSSTWNNFGTFNGVTSSNITTGKYGYGLNFNGVQWGNNYLNAGNSPSLNLSNVGTIEAWIYHKIYGSANYDMIVGKNNWPSDRNGTNFWVDNTYKLGGQLANATKDEAVIGTTVIQNYTWYHVAFVWNSTHMILYVNGKVDNTAPQTLIPKSDVYDLWIGGSPSWGASFFNGTIDEVKIWNRALSPEEINASYNSGLNRLYHNFTNLTNGVYQYYAYAIDTNGNNNKTETRTLTVGGAQAPQYFNNFVNNTVAGKPTLFSLSWTDDTGLLGYIFSTNNTGTWQNESWIPFTSINLVQNKSYNITTGSIISGTLPQVPTEGDVLIVAVTGNGINANPNVTSITQTGVTWNYVTHAGTLGGYNLINVWLGVVGAGASADFSISLHNSETTKGSIADMFEFSGINTTNYKDVNASQGDTTNTLLSTGTTATTTQANELWFGAVATHSGTTPIGLSNPTNGFTLYDSNPVSGSAGKTTQGVVIKIVNSTGTANSMVTANASGNYNGIIITFKGLNSQSTAWSNVTKTLNTTPNTLVQWCVYANDTSNNWNSTSCINPFFITTASVDNVLNLHFNEASGTSVFDSSSYGNNGIFNGETFNDGTSYNGSTPTDLHTSSGKYGKALSFDGSDDYVSIPDSNSLDVINFTAAFWIKWKGSTNYWNRILNKKLNWNDPDGWDINLVEPGTMTGGIEIEGSGSSSTTIKCVDDWRTTDLNVWHHIAVIINGSTAYLYCDGSYKGSGAIPSIVANNRPLYIGRIETETDWFNGTIDEVRIWNRTLSQAEIQAEMQSSLPVIRPVASYSFEESGSYVNDTHVWINGTYGSALSFDGVNDYVNAGNKPSLNLGTGLFTIEFWIKPNVLTDQFIINKAGDSFTTGFGITIQSGNLYGYFPGTTSQVSTSISSGAWTHIVVVRNQTSGTNLLLYKNGTLVSEGTSTSDLTVTDNLEIGGRTHGSFVWYFNGSMDEVRIWNRSLSRAEIQTEMNKG